MPEVQVAKRTVGSKIDEALALCCSARALSIRLRELHSTYTFRTMSVLSGVDFTTVRRAALREFGDRTRIEQRNLERLKAFVAKMSA